MYTPASHYKILLFVNVTFSSQNSNEVAIERLFVGSKDWRRLAFSLIQAYKLKKYTVERRRFM